MPKYLADREGNIIKDHRGDPILWDDVEKDHKGNPVVDVKGRPVLKPYAETEGKRVWEKLKALRDQKADKPMLLLNQSQENKLLNQSNNDSRQTLLDDLFDGANNKKEVKLSDEEVIKNHSETEFSKQYDDYQKQVDKEIEEYKDDFMKLSEKLAEQEKTVQDVLTKFNEEKDAQKKIKLFSIVTEEMNKLQKITENFGKAIQNTDTSEVVDTLSSYDYGYDEDTQRKVIKNL